MVGVTKFQKAVTMTGVLFHELAPFLSDITNKTFFGTMKRANKPKELQNPSYCHKCSYSIKSSSIHTLLTEMELITSWNFEFLKKYD